MQKKLFLALFGLVAMFSFSAAETFGEEEFQVRMCQAVLLSPQGMWSSPDYQPEVGDKIVAVNGQIIRDVSDYWDAVRNSPETVILVVIDHRTHQLYHLKTRLWPKHSQTRLGIFARTSFFHDGVVVTGFWPNSPGTNCQYILGETTPVYEDGIWWYN